MNKITNYINEAYTELVHKVTWPTWKELQSSAVVVLVASLIIAFLVLGMDQASNGVLKELYKILVG